MSLSDAIGGPPLHAEAIRTLEREARALDQMSRPIPNVVNAVGAQANARRAADLRAAIEVLKGSAR